MSRWERKPTHTSEINKTTGDVTRKGEEKFDPSGISG